MGRKSITNKKVRLCQIVGKKPKGTEKVRAINRALIRKESQFGFGINKLENRLAWFIRPHTMTVRIDLRTVVVHLMRLYENRFKARHWTIYDHLLEIIEQGNEVSDLYN